MAPFSVDLVSSNQNLSMGNSQIHANSIYNHSRGKEVSLLPYFCLPEGVQEICTEDYFFRITDFHSEFEPSLAHSVSNNIESNQTYPIPPTLTHPRGRTITQAFDLYQWKDIWPYTNPIAFIVYPPISRLPPEVLGIIFEFILEGKESAIIDLLLVCKEWCQTARHTPRLWMYIRLRSDSTSHFHTAGEKHRQQAQVFILNSGWLPLDIDIYYGFEILDEDLAFVRNKIGHIFEVLKGADDRIASRWGGLRIVLPTVKGRTVISAEHCGLVYLSTTALTHLSIEMLAKRPEHGCDQPSQYFTNLSRLTNLTIDDEIILKILPGTLERVEVLDIRVNQQPFNANDLPHVPHLQALILRHEEKDTRLQSAFDSNTLRDHLWPQHDPSAQADARADSLPRGEALSVPSLCIQSAWLMDSELPNLAPTRLAWDPLQPSPLEQPQHTDVAKTSLINLLLKYPLIEHLILPGYLVRPFFLLVQEGSYIVYSLQSVIFDMGEHAPRIYDWVDGKMRRRCENEL